MSVQAKTDAAGHSVSYTYEYGIIKTRSWARLTGSSHVTATYSYSTDFFHDLTALDYNDGTPSVQFSTYNRAGQPRQIIDGCGSCTLLYDHASRLVATEYTTGYNAGPLAGITVTNHFDPLGRRDSLSALNDTTPLLQHSFSYADDGRLNVVSAGPYSAAYDYLANSDLLQKTTCKNNGATVLTTTRSWEYGTRLAAILNEANGSVVSSHAYAYDALNRRTQASLEDGSIWKYDYNDRDELAAARRYWPDWSPVSGQHFRYDFDNIGNRKTSSAGGDVNGANLRQTTYTANSLNEYTGITTPGYKDICGVALATNAVTVNGNAADRRVEYFHREIEVANSGGPLWQEVTVSSGGATNTGGLIFPANNQALVYDADGNLTSDGVWTYGWDGENRLITMTNVMASIADTNRLRLEFAYDFQGRRVQKKVSHWDSGDWTLDSDSRFVYDAWNLIAILNSSFNLQTSFLWGQDLSGTIDQAGGIGGLLMATFYGTSDTNCFSTYDGNGNITTLISATDQSTSARYDYSPFGELLRTTGPQAAQNPFRFSTKFCDQETGLVYYGYRYHSPVLARWVNRDPSEENGGSNLFGMLDNNPICEYDVLGMAKGGKRQISVTGYEGWSADELAAEAKSLRALGDRSKLKHIEALEAAAKRLREYNTRLGGKYNRSRGSGGFSTLGTTILGGGVVLALDMLLTKLNTYKAISDVRDGLNNGETFSGARADLADFVRHADSGDTAWADLDAITYTIETSNGDALGALMTWDTLQSYAESAER